MIHAARVFVGDGDVIEAMTVAIDDGKIVAVEPTATSQWTGREEIDARTGTLLPGLIDTHIHLVGLKFAEVSDDLEDGTLQGPTVLGAGPVLTATGGHPAATLCRGGEWCRQGLAREVDDPEAARAVVRALAADGVDLIKLGWCLTTAGSGAVRYDDACLFPPRA